MTHAVEPAARLLAWYRRAARTFPWRTPFTGRPPKQAVDPYCVWVAEIMLQQTRTTTVIPYYERFIQRWPTVAALARARRNTVLQFWAGLGYYRRAHNVLETARIVARQQGGKFPDTPEDLLRLPGIGPYTAAAIAAIAFDAPVAAVDGNVERVFARRYGVTIPLPEARPHLRELAAAAVPARHAGAYAQALMDLGATVCTPRAPDCGICPWQEICRAHQLGIASTLPRRAARPRRGTRFGVAYLAMRSDGAVLLERQPTGKILGGMLLLPGTIWSEQRPDESDIAQAAPFDAAWRKLRRHVVHEFTHYELRLALRVAEVPLRTKAGRGQMDRRTPPGRRSAAEGHAKMSAGGTREIVH